MRAAAAAAERPRAQLLSQKSVTVKSDFLSSPPFCRRRASCLQLLGPVIYWAPLRCLWLPSGCLPGLRFSQTAASLQIIIGLGPAVWRSSTGSLLLIELDPDAGSDGENEQWSPSEPCDRSTQTEEVRLGSPGPVCFKQSRSVTLTLSGLILWHVSVEVNRGGRSEWLPPCFCVAGGVSLSRALSPLSLFTICFIGQQDAQPAAASLLRVIVKISINKPFL